MNTEGKSYQVEVVGTQRLDNTGKSYCVLGGGGSFGLATSRYLLDHGASRVIAVGRNTPKLECFTLGTGDHDRRYSYHAYHVGHELDLLMEMLDREKPRVIVNFAAQGEGATSFTHSWRYFETNCVALVRLVDELQKRDWLERFIHIGTSELYGSRDYPADETEQLHPTSPYAISKAAFDLHLMAVGRHSGFSMNIIRPSNAYGPGQQLHRIIPKAVLCGLTGKKLPLHGGGVARKSYIHTDDLARAIHGVAQGAEPCAVYNAGPKLPTPIRDVVAMVARELNIGFDDLCTVTPDRAHQDSIYWLDSSAIKRDLGWEPIISWENGLRSMVEWGKKYLPILRTLPTEFVMRA